MKLKVRFALTFAVLVGLIHVVFSIGVYWVSASFRKKEFSEKLKDRAILLTQLAEEFDSFNHALFKQFSAQPHFNLDDERICIFNQNNELLFTNNPGNENNYPADLFFKLQNADFVSYKVGDKDGVGLKIKFGGKTYTTFIEAFDYSRTDKLRELQIQLLIGFLGGLGLIILVAVFFAHQLLKPIHKLIDQIHNTTVNNLRTRIELNRNDELGELANSYNQMLDRLEKGLKSQRLFVTNASHELRTPLASTKNIIQVALEQPRDNEYYKRLLEKILDQVNRMIKLSNGLLDLAKSSNDPSNLIMKKIDLSEIIWHVHEILTTSHKDYRINIAYQNFEDNTQEIDFWGNEHLIQLMFLNVIENACKFSENKTANVHFIKLPGSVRIEIKDNGIGIEEDDLEKIFEPAYRGANSQGIPGHGLGLALVKNIAELHRIQFSIQSQKNLGTTVTFIINNQPT